MGSSEHFMRSVHSAVVLTNDFWTNCPRDVRWPQKLNGLIGNQKNDRGESMTHMGVARNPGMDRSALQ